MKREINTWKENEKSKQILGPCQRIKNSHGT